MRVLAILVTFSVAQAAIDSTMAYTSFDSQDESGGSESEAEITANLRSEEASIASAESSPTQTSLPADMPQATSSIVSISSIKEYINKLFKSMYSYMPGMQSSLPMMRETQEHVQYPTITTITTGRSKHESYSVASVASGGFFTDMREEDFKLLRNIACYENLNKVQEFVDKGVDSISAMDSYMDKTFWQQNYEPVFGCQFQRRMG